MKKILIAEDSIAIQGLARKIFQNHNYEIETAKNGKQVLEKMANADYNAILMDIHMPEMDGMQTARAIRDLDSVKCLTPLIAITGNLQNYTPEDFVESGFNKVMHKPINFDILLKWTEELTTK